MRETFIEELRDIVNPLIIIPPFIGDSQGLNKPTTDSTQNHKIQATVVRGIGGRITSQKVHKNREGLSYTFKLYTY